MIINSIVLDDGQLIVTNDFDGAIPEEWAWIDVERESDDEDSPAWFALLGIDELATHDAFNELDHPKFDDFGDHALLVLHGLRSNERVETYELDCFITQHTLVTVHRGQSPAVDAMRVAAMSHPALLVGGSGEVAARLADGVTRRILAIVDAFDLRVDAMIEQALVADRQLLNDVAAVRSDVSSLRRIVHPQRETLDLVRTSESELLTDLARRRFSDVFDVAQRTAYGLDTARSALAETVDAYRAAEARSATEVSKVLTIYAAVLLPLSLVVGFFGMNHSNLPTIGSDWGWIAVTALMVLFMIGSIGVFVAQGWIGRPSGRRAGTTLGRGLAEAARAPAHVAGAVFAMSTMPLTSAKSRLGKPLTRGKPPK